MDNKIRVLILDLPGMLRTILERAVALQDDMVLVKSDALSPDEAVRTHHPAALIVGFDSAISSGTYEFLLAEHPRLKIFAISRDGREARVSELRNTVYLDPALETLIEVVRDSVLVEALSHYPGARP